MKPGHDPLRWFGGPPVAPRHTESVSMQPTQRYEHNCRDERHEDRDCRGWTPDTGGLARSLAREWSTKRATQCRHGEPMEVEGTGNRQQQASSVKRGTEYFVTAEIAQPEEGEGIGD